MLGYLILYLTKSKKCLLSVTGETCKCYHSRTIRENNLCLNDCLFYRTLNALLRKSVLMTVYINPKTVRTKLYNGNFECKIVTIENLATIEFGKDIEKGFLLSYNLDGKPSTWIYSQEAWESHLFEYASYPIERQHQAKSCRKGHAMWSLEGTVFCKKGSRCICEVDSISSIPHNLKQVE